MKKIFFITLILVIGIMLPVFAANTIETTGTPGETIITYGVSNGFKVIIPADFTITEAAEESQTVSASDVYIAYGETLRVSLKGENFDETESKWYLVDEANDSNKIEYTIGTTSGSADVTNDSVILEVAAGDINGEEVDLFFNVVKAPTIAGTYNDTLSFTVTVE